MIDSDNVWEYGQIPCSPCDGKGEHKFGKCRTCDGTGFVYPTAKRFEDAQAELEKAERARKRQTNALRREAEQRARRDRWKAFADTYPPLAEEIERGEKEGSEFFKDLASYVRTYGALTEAQKAAVKRSLKLKKAAL